MLKTKVSHIVSHCIVTLNERELFYGLVWGRRSEFSQYFGAKYAGGGMGFHIMYFLPGGRSDDSLNQVTAYSSSIGNPVILSIHELYFRNR